MHVNGLKPSFSIERVHRSQLQLSKQVIRHDALPRRIRFVAGVDVAYTKDLSIGAVAVLDYATQKVLESETAVCRTRFPYIPTLLSFREIQPAVLSINKLQLQPDVFLVDGHGIAHPYRCGFASHLGLVLKKPTVGVAKKRLCGSVEDSRRANSVALLRHEDEVIGAAVTTNDGRKPVYVSVGHMVSLETAIKTVKHCTHTSRVPKPISEAHKTATAEKRKVNIALTFNR